MSEARSPGPILTEAQLAERWSMSLDTFRRRLPRLRLSGLNFGSVRKPDWRFRLAGIEEWERANEATIGAAENVPESQGEPILTGRPPCVPEGFDAFKGRNRGRGLRQR